MDFWDKVARLYDAAEFLNGKVYREMVRLTKSLVPRHAAVLECAGGTGELSLAAAEKADSVFCTDNSETMLDVAREKARKRGFENIKFGRQNIFNISANDEEYDVVIAGNVLHLLENPENAVRELYRVTKRGGRILLPTFVTRASSAFTKATLKIYELLRYNPSTEYTPRSYVFMLKGCNLGTVKAKLIKGMVPCCYAVIVKE
ncbi:MAG: class I SAM-dependent methyltransferase [Oscillospiraceae bacterium]|nr:class I SAM-dependent methyltransferase [Oscillospiraceae bacterium]